MNLKYRYHELNHREVKWFFQDWSDGSNDESCILFSSYLNSSTPLSYPASASLELQEVRIQCSHIPSIRTTVQYTSKHERDGCKAHKDCSSNSHLHFTTIYNPRRPCKEWCCLYPLQNLSRRIFSSVSCFSPIQPSLHHLKMQLEAPG